MVSSSSYFKLNTNILKCDILIIEVIMKKQLILLISIFFICINNVYAKELVKFSKCVDGDTIKVIIDNEEYTIRMLSIDTPEITKEEKPEYYAKEASDYTCKKITKAKKIELEYDPKSDKFDKYQRLLAWVFVDSKLLQEELIEKGYAKVAYLYDDYKYNDILKEKQELASAKNIGIWNEQAKKEYEENKTKPNETHENIEIVIVTIILLIITFIFKLFKKVKKK